MNKNCFAEKGIWIVRGLLLLVAVWCLVHICMPKRSISYDGTVDVAGGMADVTVYEGISLKPGVWRVQVSYSTEADYATYIYLEDGTVFDGGLKSNGDHLYRERSQTDFNMWLYESTEALSVKASTDQNSPITFTGVTFVETNGLWTMLFTVDGMLALLVFLLRRYRMVWSRQLDREGRMVVWGIAWITLLASFFPLTEAGLRGIDLTFHYLRIEGVKDGILSGTLPVRIEPEWLFGQGYACGIFYCNLLLFFPALLRVLGFSVVTACNLFFIVMNLATAVIAYACFAKIFDSKRIGIALSALDTLSTHRVYKLYQTGDFGDGLAFTFFPLIILGFYRAFTEDTESPKYKTVWIPLAAGYAGLMQTHVLTCEITLFLTILLCLVYIRKVLRRATFVQLAKGATTAFLLSAWFIVPFLDYYLTQNVHIKNLTARMIQDRGMNIVHLFFHFWDSGEYVPTGQNGAYHTYAVGVGLVLVVALAIFLILWWNRFPGTDGKAGVLRLGKYAACVSALLLWMSTQLFPWDFLQGLSETFAPLISSLEFPTRVIGWATALLVCVFGAILWYFEKKGMQRLFWGGILAVVLAITTSSGYLSEAVLLHAGTFTVYNEEGMGTGFVSDGEYLMEGVNASALTVEKPSWSEGVTVTAYEKKYLTVDMTCVNESDEDGWVDLPILWYRDYAAHTTDGEVLLVNYNDRYQVRVYLPAGYSGEFKVAFESPWYWRVCEGISLLSALAFVGYGLVRYYNRRKGAQTDEA